jgi:hypothetical protein
VLTDALRAARARSYDAVVVDTAGRLHTKGNLMSELAKMARVAGKEVPGAPHDTLLVLDATVGSNGWLRIGSSPRPLLSAESFDQAGRHGQGQCGRGRRADGH